MYILLQTGRCSPWNNYNNTHNQANLACFTSHKVSNYDVCLQETCKTWGRLQYLINITAAYYFIGYYIGGYQHAGWYLTFIIKPILVNTDNVPKISCIPSANDLNWDAMVDLFSDNTTQKFLTHNDTVSSSSFASYISLSPLILCRSCYSLSFLNSRKSFNLVGLTLPW